MGTAVVMTNNIYTRVPKLTVLKVHNFLAQAELENHPDILLTLTTPPNSPPLDHLVVHPCVQTADVSVATPSNGSRNRKIRFSAPLESFTLCHYQASGIPFLPIRGFYQMKVHVCAQPWPSSGACWRDMCSPYSSHACATMIFFYTDH